MDDYTIAAIATPIGSGGIGIIRISGALALPIAASIFQRSNFSLDKDKCSDILSCFKSHRFYHGHIVDQKNKQILDEVLFVVMKAPHSYTREDVVEIHAHSGPVALNSILELTLRKGARLAEAGEFTKRAYLNGRIDLTQAEAVIDIINAKTVKSLAFATAQIKGGIRTTVESIRKSLFDILTNVNAVIDFPDEIEEIMETDATIEFLQNKIIDPLKNLVDSYNDSHVFRDGVKIVIVGKPNVGKSSLMNCLIQKDRSIISSMPGTTRDVIEEHINIQGISTIITDTAGLHKTDNPVEIIGIEKAHECIDTADVVLFIVDANCSLTAEDYEIQKQIQNRVAILAINKMDIVKNNPLSDIPKDWANMPTINISALYNKNINNLKVLIAQTVLHERNLCSGSSVVPNLRHKLALERCISAVSIAMNGLRNGNPFELIAIDIKEAINALDEITGISVEKDVIEGIFNRFCIGK